MPIPDLRSPLIASMCSSNLNPNPKPKPNPTVCTRSIRPHSTTRHLTDEFELTCLTQQSSTNRAPTRTGGSPVIWGWCQSWCLPGAAAGPLFDKWHTTFSRLIIVFYCGISIWFLSLRLVVSFCPMLPRGGAATATEHKFSYNFKQSTGGGRVCKRRVLCLDHNGAFVTKLANWINRFHFVYLLVIKHLCFDFLSALRANQMNHLHFCSMLLCFFVSVDLFCCCFEVSIVAF